MPVNYQQALQQIREMGKQAPRMEAQMQELREQVNNLFKRYACELDTLQQLAERATVANPHLRCAMPYRECLDQRTAPPPLEPRYTLLAADGSQINPDRHSMVEFGAINVGTIRMLPGQGQAAQEQVRSQLMFLDALYTENGSPLTDDIVALMRDMAERQELVNLARSEAAPVVTLTDGPLELFREGKGMPEFEEKFQEYLKVLGQLADLEVATAGYVDKPRSDLVVRLLELVVLARDGRLDQAGYERPFRQIDDTQLFLDLLEPGERSAVFAIQSGSAQRFKDQLRLHYFYLNVGRPGHPYLSRVEIPLWVAENERLLNLLHAILLEQSYQLGVRAYPYILHRAHEIAVISFQEHDQLENMIVAELRRQGVPVGERSHKQVAKDTQYS